MLDQAEIAKIEERLNDSGKSVAELCREAKIAETTWGRWKRGDFHPSFSKSKAVLGAVDRLTKKSAAADEAA
jgi:predicted transcriptional regulator